MLVWLTIIKLLKKAWAWIKEYWYVPALLVYTFFVWFFSRKNSAAALEVLSIRKESYEKQIDAINESHAAEIAARDAAIEKYYETMEKIEDNHKNDLEDLNNKKKKQIKELVNKYHNKPDELAKRISEEFGYEYEE